LCFVATCLSGNAHNLKVVGSNPTPATNLTKAYSVFEISEKAPWHTGGTLPDNTSQQDTIGSKQQF